MAKPLRRQVLEELHKRRIPAILIGAQAVKVLGSSRESFDVDFAARIIDVDAIIDFMYALGFRLPMAAPEIGRVRWAKSAAAAKRFVEAAKAGALNFFITDADDQIVDQVDFVVDHPIPFARLSRDAVTLATDPLLKRASVDHLIAMKEKRIAAGQGKATDEADLAFLRELKRKR